jgi:hypothetical protein
MEDQDEGNFSRRGRKLRVRILLERVGTPLRPPKRTAILSAEVDPSTVEDIIYDIKKGIFIVFIEDQRYGSETEYQKWKEIYFESWWTLDCESLPDRALTPPLFT